MAKPEKSIAVGSVHASVFVNEGEKGSYRTATIHRRFKRDDGSWDSSDSFTLSQLLQLRAALDATVDYMIDQQGE